MMLEIPGLLNEAQLKKIDEILSNAEFVDGKLTAGMAAQRVKNNEELKREPEKQELLIRILMASLSHNEEFKAAALPA
ncbi:MAG: Fe2+-dependent dioxygenase, partial [Candidatus Sedimenticola sp. 6PFRAG5]